MDYSDLLVGFRDDKLFNDELTESSNSDETSPTKTYNLFKSLDFEIEEIKTIDNEKLIYPGSIAHQTIILQTYFY